MSLQGISQKNSNINYNSKSSNVKPDDKINNLIEKVLKTETLDPKQVGELSIALNEIKDNAVLKKLATKLINYPKLVNQIVSNMRLNTLDSEAIKASTSTTSNDGVSSRHNISIESEDPVDPGFKFTFEAKKAFDNFKPINNNPLENSNSVEGTVEASAHSSEYNAASERLNISIDAFKSELGKIKDPEKYQDAVKVLNDLSTQYQGIIAKGDQVKIAIFSSFMDKVTKGLDDINNGGDVNLSDIMQQNNDMMTRIFGDNPPGNVELTTFFGKEALEQINSTIVLQKADKLIKSVNDINIPADNPNAAKLNIVKEKVNASVNTILSNINSMTPEQKNRLVTPLANLMIRYKESMKDPAQAAYLACVLDKMAQASEQLKNGQPVNMDDFVDKSNKIIRSLDSKSPPSVADLKVFLGAENFQFLASIVNSNSTPQQNNLPVNNLTGKSNPSAKESLPVFSSGKAPNDQNVITALASSLRRDNVLIIKPEPENNTSIASSIVGYFKELNTGNNSGKPEKTSESITITSGKKSVPEDLLIKQTIVQSAKKISPANIRNLFRENSKLSNTFKNFRTSIADFKKAATKELSHKLHNLKAPRNKTKELFNLLSELKKETYKQTTASERISTQLEKAIQQIQASIEKLVDKLDLSVDPSPASIVPLLAKFRKIITELDIDTKNIIKSSLEKQLLSNKFQSNKKEAKDSENTLDKLKLIILEGLSKSVI